jgi:putative GTP pyrophosphokinase
VSEESESPDSRADLYEKLQPVYEAFVDKLEGHLEDRLDDVGASYAWVESWTWSAERYRQALWRMRKEQPTGLDPADSDGPSFAGVRIITHNPSNFDTIVTLIDDEFLVDTGASNSGSEPRDQHLRRRSDTAPIEYPFPRYVIALTDERCVLPEWKPYDGLRAEIDVMTLLQYSWVWTDRNLSYYWAGTYPSITRSLLDDAIGHLVAADETLADFERLTDDMEQEYIDAVRRGDVDLELNGDSLQSYVSEAEVVSNLTSAAVEAGMRRDDEYKLGPKWAEELLWVLRMSDIETLPDLDRFLDDASHRAPDLLRQIVLLAGERDFVPWAVPDSIIIWLLLVLRRADDTTVELTDQHKALEYALNTLIGNQVTSDDRPTNGS